MYLYKPKQCSISFILVCLCSFQLTAADVTFHSCADDYQWIYIDGRLASNLNPPTYCINVDVNISSTARVIGIAVENGLGPGGWAGYFSDYSVVSDGSWKCTEEAPNNNGSWATVGYNDSSWSAPTQTDMPTTQAVLTNCLRGYFSTAAKWLWTINNWIQGQKIYCRKMICPATTWGAVNCSNSCSNGCSQSLCDATSGVCMYGCVQWYTGSQCENNIVPLNVTQATFVEVGGTLSTANVSFSWTVSPVPDNQTIQFYTYAVQYRQKSISTWTNIGVKQNWTNVTVPLQRNVAYAFTITPVRTLNGLTENSNTSIEYQYTPGCINQTWGTNCGQICGHCSSQTPQCDSVTGKCKNGCTQWYAGDLCNTTIELYRVQNLNVTIATDNSVTVQWICQTEKMTPELQQYYHFYITTSATSPLNSTQLWTVIEGAAPPSGVYGMTVTVTPCRTQYTKMDCNVTLSQTMSTPCGVPDEIKNVVVFEKSKDASIAVYTLSWQSPTYIRCAGPVTYIVSVWEKSSSRKKRDATPVVNVTTQNAVLDVTLPSDKSYDVSVTAVNNNGATSQPYFLPGGIVPSLTSGNLNMALGIGLGVGLGLLVIIIVAVVLIVVRRRRDKELGEVTREPVVPISKPSPSPLVKRKVSANLANDNSRVSDHSSSQIEIKHLQQRIKEMRDEKQFTEQFKAFPAGAIKGVPMTESCKPDSKIKNRFNIKPYDFNRVVLEPNSHRKPPTYINASYIDGFQRKRKYIATQAPKKDAMEDFWCMIWEQNCYCIVMLTNLMDNGKAQSERYWPLEASKGIKCGQFKIHLITSDIYAYYVIRKLTLIKTLVDSKEESRTITQYHFTAWPDKNIPDHCLPLVLFHQLVTDRMAEDDSGPLVVHCSAGAGRTGTFIALDILMEQAMTTGVVDVLACVHELRRQRIDMVQREMQYEFLHDVLLYELVTSGGCLENGIYVNNDASDAVQHKFEVLSVLQSVAAPSVPSDLGVQSVEKNRTQDIIPSNKNRPFLNTLKSFSNDYINAVFVSSLRKFEGFVITQSPLPVTIEDFWSLVYDHNCSVIVTLDNIDGKTEDVPVFWPPHVGTAHGCLQLSCVADGNTDNNFFSQQYTITSDRDSAEGERTVQHIYVNVESTSTIQYKHEALSRVVTELECVRVSEEQRILLHCRDGVKLSTVLCALLIAIEQKKMGQDVDLFTAVQFVRITRPQAVHSLMDYKLLHSLMETYLAQIMTYAN